jgi:hypothetical protein
MRDSLTLSLFLTSSVIWSSNGIAAMDIEHAQRCKNIIMTETREFMDLPMAAFSVSEGRKGQLDWSIHWDGMVAGGICNYEDQTVQGVQIEYHLMHSSDQVNGEGYSGKYGGFYYDRHVGQWRDPDGAICHTCSPQNGFPEDGG